MRYGILRRLKRGIRLDIMPTFRCNYDCFYCVLKMGGSKMPISPEKPLEYWISYVRKFPIKVREVFLSGGEPTIYKGVDKLINEYLNMGLLVTVFTNGSNPEVFENIKPTNRLRLIITRHLISSSPLMKHFNSNVKILKESGFNVDIHTFEYGEGEKHQDLRLSGATNRISANHLRSGPDGLIFRTCAERYSYYLDKNDRTKKTL